MSRFGETSLETRPETSPRDGQIGVYTQRAQGQAWLERHRGGRPTVVCVLGFTDTGLIEGISAAGATPADRRYTAIADAEFLYHGPQPFPQHPLPPLQVGASPVLMTRAVVTGQRLPLVLINAGLPQPPAAPCLDFGGQPARCLSSGQALARGVVEHLFWQGWDWGTAWARTHGENEYLVVGECVVGGTTTALAVLTGLGFAAQGKVNSSHPTCNHGQKWPLVQAGLQRAGLAAPAIDQQVSRPDPLAVVAAVGDPMQVVVAGLALAAGQRAGVLLAGGTQMLAVYALAREIATAYPQWAIAVPDTIAVGTTRWVAEDRTGDTVGLATAIGDVPLLATLLSFAQSRHAQLRAYEQGFVKEGVGAGGCAIAAHLYQNWGQTELLGAIDQLGDQL